MEQAVIEVSESRPLTKNDILAQVQLIQEVMRNVMHDGEHYGVIPGCGQKPTLLKAGAEKILMTFRMAPEFEVVPMFPGEDNKVGYRVTCRVVNRDGKFMGSGVGEASSEEKKWKWRKAVCQEEWDEADPAERRKKWEAGGKFELQVMNNPFDLSNTILKMAKKRAQVDATLTATACSDIFTQDIEETGDLSHAKEQKKPAPGPCAPKTTFFKEWAGKPWAEMPRDQLDWYADAINQNLMDPKKAQYKKQNEATLDAIIAELDRRNEMNRTLDAQAMAEAKQ